MRATAASAGFANASPPADAVEGAVIEFVVEDDDLPSRRPPAVPPRAGRTTRSRVPGVPCSSLVVSSPHVPRLAARASTRAAGGRRDPTMRGPRLADPRAPVAPARWTRGWSHGSRRRTACSDVRSGRACLARTCARTARARASLGRALGRPVLGRLGRRHPDGCPRRCTSAAGAGCSAAPPPRLLRPGPRTVAAAGTARVWAPAPGTVTRARSSTAGAVARPAPATRPTEVRRVAVRRWAECMPPCE